MIRPSLPDRSSARASGEHGEGDEEQDQTEAIRADVCMAAVASVNSLAMVEAMVEPESNRLLGKACELPMMKVTAMVSPRARPRPSITAPMAPRRT